MVRLKEIVSNFIKKNELYKNLTSVILTVFVVKVLGFLKEIYIGNEFGMSEELDLFFILILIPTFFNNVFLGSFKAVIIPNYIYAQKKGNQRNCLLKKNQ